MKLKPPKGCAAISIGGETHVLGSDGLMDVPEEAAAMLMQSHGFTRPLEPKTMPPSKGRGRGSANAARRSRE